MPYCKYIKKLYIWLVICIAKNFIWTNLKSDFLNILILFHPQIPDFEIVVYFPILTNHTSMESLFIQLSDYVEILSWKCWHLWPVFVVQGHKYYYIWSCICIKKNVFTWCVHSSLSIPPNTSCVHNNCVHTSSHNSLAISAVSAKEIFIFDWLHIPDYIIFIISLYDR